MSRPVTPLGNEAKRPLVVGRDNRAPARYIETTGLAHGVQKGRQKWVTGSGVQEAIESGLFIELDIPGVPPGFARVVAEDRMVVRYDVESGDVAVTVPGVEDGSFEEIAYIRSLIDALHDYLGDPPDVTVEVVDDTYEVTDTVFIPIEVPGSNAGTIVVNDRDARNQRRRDQRAAAAKAKVTAG